MGKYRLSCLEVANSNRAGRSPCPIQVASFVRTSHSGAATLCSIGEGIASDASWVTTLHDLHIRVKWAEADSGQQNPSN